MLAKLALLFLVVMALIVMVFGRPRKGDKAGRGRRPFSRLGRPPEAPPDPQRDRRRDRDRDHDV